MRHLLRRDGKRKVAYASESSKEEIRILQDSDEARVTQAQGSPTDKSDVERGVLKNMTHPVLDQSLLKHISILDRILLNPVIFIDRILLSPAVFIAE